MADGRIGKEYDVAKEQYAGVGVDVDQVLQQLAGIGLSLHSGCEADAAADLRADLDQAFALIPGALRLNLDAACAETGGKRVERNALEPAHFQSWIAWAKSKGIGMDFSPAFCGHPMAEDGFTLAHADPSIRRFWVEHGQVSRRIAAAIGEALGSPCVMSVSIPDGCKDAPIDRRGPRERLAQSLDALFAESLEPDHIRDAVECRLDSRAYTVASPEFCLGYAIERGVLLRMDADPDRLSAVMCWLDELLLHASGRATDGFRAIAQAIVRGGYLDRTHIRLSAFGAPAARVTAWVTGARAMRKALLFALLEPIERWQDLEASGDAAALRAQVEEFNALSFDAIWDRCCIENNVPPDDREVLPN